MLTEIFSKTSDVEVVGVASDPLIARDKIKQLNPDVLRAFTSVNCTLAQEAMRTFSHK